MTTTDCYATHVRMRMTWKPRKSWVCHEMRNWKVKMSVLEGSFTIKCINNHDSQQTFSLTHPGSINKSYQFFLAFLNIRQIGFNQIACRTWNWTYSFPLNRVNWTIKDHAMQTCKPLAETPNNCSGQARNTVFRTILDANEMAALV